MIDRSKFKRGDRISWFLRPKSGGSHRTGTIIGVNWSQRTGLSWVAEVDQYEGRNAIVKPQHDPLPLKQWKDVKEGDRVRLPPDRPSGDPHVLVGEMVEALQPGDNHATLFIKVGGGRLVDRTEVPMDPEGEVAIISERDGADNNV